MISNAILRAFAVEKEKQCLHQYVEIGKVVVEAVPVAVGSSSSTSSRTNGLQYIVKWSSVTLGLFHQPRLSVHWLVTEGGEVSCSVVVLLLHNVE